MLAGPVAQPHINGAFRSLYNNITHGYSIHYSSINHFKRNTYLPYAWCSKHRFRRAYRGLYNTIADQDIFKTSRGFCAAFDSGAKTAHDAIGDGNIFAGSCPRAFEGDTIIICIHDAIGYHHTPAPVYIYRIVIPVAVIINTDIMDNNVFTIEIMLVPDAGALHGDVLH
jgi:hypothetical protein